MVNIKKQIKERAFDGLYSIIGGIADLRDKFSSPKVEKTIDEMLTEELSFAGKKLHSAIGGMMTSAILPSQMKWGMESQERVLSIQPGPDTYDSVSVSLNAETHIPTYVIGDSQTKQPQEKKYIIYFPGNGEYSLSYLEIMRKEAQEKGCVFIAFDYPGVGNSSGKTKSPKDMVDAGYAQVQRLLEMGVPANNIMVKGQSIGGGVATLVAAKCHENNHRVYLFNQRSFSKLSKAAGHLSGLPGPFKKIAEKVIKSIGWEMNSKAAWQKIPEGYKGFSHATEDRVIPTKVSLAKAIKQHEDPDKAIQCGHNDDLSSAYGYQQTVSRKNAFTVFDSFYEKVFGKPEMALRSESGVQATIASQSPTEMQQTVNSEDRTAFLQVVKNLHDECLTFPNRKSESSRKSFLMSTEVNPATANRELHRIMQNFEEKASKFASKTPITSADISQIEAEMEATENILKKIERFNPTNAETLREALAGTKTFIEKIKQPQNEEKVERRRRLES